MDQARDISKRPENFRARSDAHPALSDVFDGNAAGTAIAQRFTIINVPGRKGMVMTGETVLLADLAHHLDVDRGIETPIEDWLQLIRAEYLEMPGLHLTGRQAQRLWNLDAGTCDALLEMLIADRFLKKMPNGAYARSEDGAH